MLLERAAQLRASLTEHQALMAAGKQGQVYQSRSHQLTPLAEALARAKRDWTAIRSAGLDVENPSPKPGLKAQIADILLRFQADPDVLAAPDEKFRFEFLPGITKATEELDARSAAAWSAHVASRAQFPTDAILRALDAVPSYRSSVLRIREAANEVQKLRSNVPGAADLRGAMGRLNEAVTKKDAALAAMQGDDLPNEVQVFLRKTGQGGAELRDLTPTVLSWLDDRGLAGAFRVTPDRT
ncbi:hypothetical protein [Mesorhizobium sp.]|uniref:hypothetical protein n=1 Tax=Mesorhizobium sp. TaxID=1871066 RepID=UPI000FE40906|nr:hypothetical protein [Mesorhizobium sp.]RWO03013.1 MAG: hypothetical protein EOS06_02550 [Mesorhizobium sp.]